VSAKWTIFTNHAHVLFCISEDPDATLRAVAMRVGITERAAQRIVAELEESGYLKHERRGRRNHYQVMTELPLRHDIESHVSLGDIIRVLQRDAAKQ